MKRRALLQSLGVLPLMAGGWAPLIVRSATALVSKRIPRVRPTDRAWPSAESWERLNRTVGGNLLSVHALFGSCNTDPNGAACREAVRNIRNPYWIGDQPAGTQVSGWLDAWTPASSVYAVKARHAADVAEAIRFARRTICGWSSKAAGTAISAAPTPQTRC